jgi:hypothetical protein
MEGEKGAVVTKYATIVDGSCSRPKRSLRRRRNASVAHILWQITIFHVAMQSPCFNGSGLLPLHRNETLETIPYNLAVATMVAAYSQSLPPIDVGTLQTPPGDPALCECRPPPFKEAKGRL